MDWQGLWRRIALLVSRGRVALVEDGAAAQAMQVRLGSHWVQDRVPRMAEYGFQSVPPAGSDVVVLFMRGDPSEAVVIATGNQTYRLKSLSPGEVAISDNKGQAVKLLAGGIVIEGSTLPVTVNASAGVTINGPVTINGAATINGNVENTGTLKNNGVVVGSPHTHVTGITGLPTGPVIP